ncbi:MAG: DUF2846 domain-containing protein [Halopseudomonas sp.]
MFKKIIAALTVVASAYLTGCASVPMESVEEDLARKEFNAPPEGKAGLYLYRDSMLGAALKKTVYIDGEMIGETAPKTYFYQDIAPGEHQLSTESEFSDNLMKLMTESGKNYYVRQYIRMGAFIGGANLELMSEKEGQQGVLECKLAK